MERHREEMERHGESVYNTEAVPLKTVVLARKGLGAKWRNRRKTYKIVF